MPTREERLNTNKMKLDGLSAYLKEVLMTYEFHHTSPE